MKLQQIDYYQLAKAMLAEKALDGPAANYAHGPGGIFSTPGLSQSIFNTMALPIGGLGARLPAQTTIEDTMLIGLITGVDDEEGGDEPDSVCDEPKSVGLARGCVISFPLGLISRKSPVIHLTNYGKVTNRGEFRDLKLIGNVGIGRKAPFIPSKGKSNTLEGQMFNGAWNIGLGFGRKLGRMTYTGNSANSTTGGGYKEFKGLDILINTGYQDAQNPAVNCEAVDSVVVDFKSANIATDGTTTVKAIVSTYRNLQIRAELTGLAPVSWCIAMRGEAFYELTAIWPCAYATSGCMVNDGEGQRLMVSADAQVALRDDMRNNSYLLIDGVKITVVKDPYIPQEQPTATLTFESDIYFVPEFVLGRIPVAYWEFTNYNTKAGVMAMASQLASTGMYQVSDSGRFLWHMKPPANYCVQLACLTEPRLVLLTPHLAARIVNVQYSTIQLYRASHPEDVGYVAGGVSKR
jgi:hypothetical protein